MEHLAIQHNSKATVAKKQSPFFGKKKVAGFFAPACIQPKLTIGPVDDPYEKEADAVAEKVMRMSDTETLQTKPAPVNIQRKCAHCEEEEQLQRKEDGVQEAMPQINPVSGAVLKRKCPHCEGELIQKKPNTGIVQRDTPGSTTLPDEDKGAPGPGPLSIRVSVPGVNTDDTDSKINFAQANIEIIGLGINNPADFTIPYTELWKTNYQLSTKWGLGNAVRHFYDARSKLPLFSPKIVEGGDWDKFFADKTSLSGLSAGFARDNKPYNEVSGFNFTVNIVDFNFDENNLSGRYKNNERLRKKDEARRKADGAAGPGAMTAPAAVHDTLSASGQPIDPDTRNFMESRFGYDFGNVQIHNDSAAHQSSASINALAYTNQNHVVFGAGQYQPSTRAGKQLLAHELTHVMQQQQPGKTTAGGHRFVNRKITYSSPADTTQDPIDLLLNSATNHYVAVTNMTLNGKPGNGAIVSSAFDASNLRFTVNPTTGAMDIDPSNVKLVIGADRILWDPPPKTGKWSGYHDRVLVPGYKTNCGSGPQVYVELKGIPDSTTFYNRIIQNEDDHVNDLQSVGHILELYLNKIKKRTLPPCTGQPACEAAYNQQYQTQDAGIVAQFFNVWNSIASTHDDPVTGRHKVEWRPPVENTCSRVKIEIHSTFP